MTDLHTIAETVHELAREGFVHEFGKPEVKAQPSEVWHRLRSAGTALWLDTGDMDEAAALWNADFEALTTNNTLLNKEVQKGIYDDLVKRAAAAIRAAAPEIAQKQLLLEIAFVLNARHGLGLVRRFDAFVSVELHTDLAGDVEQTVWYGKRYHAICPKRFYVKVPFTPAGLLGARQLEQAGVPVNLTLGFSARQNYLIALFANPSFVNVFMGRLNAFVADNKLGDGRNVGEKATLATQRELLALRREGRTRSRLIGASMRDGSQAGSLAGVDVFTMPPKVAAQYQKRPLAAVLSQVHNDPGVTTAAGIRINDYAGNTLWDVPLAFKRTVESLLRKDAKKLTPDDIVRHFQREGLGDFLPTWALHDRQTAAADGKIPVYAHWKDRLAPGRLGLDALMNLSALYSFVADQTALDNRVRSLVQ